APARCRCWRRTRRTTSTAPSCATCWPASPRSSAACLLRPASALYPAIAQPPREAFRQRDEAATREQHEQDQQQAQPELPIRGGQAREAVLQDHEDRRADDAAVEIARAADHQHDEDVGRALEAQDVDADELRR